MESSDGATATIENTSRRICGEEDANTELDGD